MSNKAKHVNLNMPEELWRKVKSKSALQGKTITQWLIELLEKEVKE